MAHTPVDGSPPPGLPAPGGGERQATGFGVFTTDTALAVRTWDAWLASATGITAGAVRGRALTEVVPDLASRGLLATFERVLSDGTIEMLAPAFHGYLIACPPVGGSPTFGHMQQRVTIGPLREDGHIVGVIVAVEDVTARVEREREVARQLSHLDPDVRLRAVGELAEAAPISGRDPLLDAIGDDDWRVRRAAVGALGRRSTADAIAAVLQALRDDHRNFSVLSSAVELLAVGDLDIVEPLLELLRYPDPDLRLQAALVLGERGDARAVPALLEALADADENLRFHAIEALGKLKAATAVEALADIAETGEFFLAFPALEALAAIGDPAVAPRLAPLMAHDLLRGAVAETLGRIGDEDAVAPLVRLLNDATAPTEVVAEALAAVYDRYEVRYHDGEHVARLTRLAITATGTQNLLDTVQRAGVDELRSIAKVLGWLETPAVDRALTRLLGQPSLRSKVVEYLVRHGARVVDLLIEQLGAEDPDIRHAAIVGLGRIGDRRATPPLLQLLLTDASLTAAVAGALARLGDPRAFEPLLPLLGHPDAAVRLAVIAALNSIGHPEMAGRVTPLLRDPDPRVRESAVRIAGYFGYAQSAGDLLACCTDPEAAVQRAALEHLSFLDDPRVLPVLAGALSAPAAAMRCAAAQALARLDDPDVAGLLVGALSDSDAWVRYFAVRGLAEHPDRVPIATVSRLAVDDPAGHVRLAAIATLGASGSGEAVPALAVLAASDDLERASAALHALGVVAHADAWAPLEAVVREGDDARRIPAAEALARVGGAAAVELLQWTAAGDGSDAVASAAAQALAAMARRLDGSAIDALVTLAAEPRHREAVISALAAVPASAVDQVAHGLRDPSPAVRAAIVQALGRMRRPEASRWLQAGLDDAVAEVRVATLTELRNLGTRGIERRVVSLARTDPDAAVRRAALAVLKRVPGAADVGGSADVGRNPAR